jgi:hypothetical protein
MIRHFTKILFFLFAAIPVLVHGQASDVNSPLSLVSEEDVELYFNLTHLPGPTDPARTTPSLESTLLPSRGSISRLVETEDITALADLDVAFIQQKPGYAYDAKQKWPVPGENVTFNAHVANRGTLPSGPFSYRWHIDGILQLEGTHVGLNPGETDLIDLNWEWKPGNYLVQLCISMFRE